MRTEEEIITAINKIKKHEWKYGYGYCKLALEWVLGSQWEPWTNGEDLSVDEEEDPEITIDETVGKG